MEYVLTTEHLCKNYGHFKALNQCSMHVPRGAIYGFVGKNGAGKTTLMNILSGTFPPTAGKIVIDGKEITGMTPQKSKEMKIRFIHQELNLCNDLKVYENMYLGEEITNKTGLVDKKAEIARAQEVLDGMGVKISATALVADLETAKKQLVEIVRTLREKIPDIVLRTTLITGFPGETQEDHEELMEFVDTMEFDRLGVFTYSPEENTPAAVMKAQISEEIKEDRKAELMELQQEISLERGNSRIGQVLLVMIEGKVADENAYVGRTYADAPNVDGYIFVQSPEMLMSGDFVKVRVTGALEYDLIGEIYDEYAE